MARLFQGGLDGGFPRTVVSFCPAASAEARRGGAWGSQTLLVTCADQGSQGWEQDTRPLSASLMPGLCQVLHTPAHDVLIVPRGGCCYPHFTEKAQGRRTCPQAGKTMNLHLSTRKAHPPEAPLGLSWLPQFPRSRE